MGENTFFMNKEKLDYVLSGSEFGNCFDVEIESGETPSVFYLNLKYEDEIYVPVTVFRNEFTPFQAIIKYLKENLNLNNKEIALRLGRATRDIWAVYDSIDNKKTLSIDETKLHIPLTIFKDDKLSAFETLVSFLTHFGMSYAEIARQLNRDQRTIWTIHSRAKNKLESVKHEQ